MADGTDCSCDVIRRSVDVSKKILINDDWPPFAEYAMDKMFAEVNTFATSRVIIHRDGFTVMSSDAPHQVF